MSRPMVHISKKQAIFELIKCLIAHPFTEITDLANGEIILETIQTRFNQFNDCPPENENLRWNFIRQFIDDHYGINSEIIIDYKEAQKYTEVEIVKALLFVLVAVVNHLMLKNDPCLESLYTMDNKIQKELEDIFKVFIKENYRMLSKTEIETVLSRCSKKASPDVTPRRTSLRRAAFMEQNSLTPKEGSSTEVYSSSPLKLYFESPIYKKEDIQKLKRKIVDMEKMLYAADEEYQRKLSEMEKELEKKDSDYEKYKKQNSRLLQEKDQKIADLKMTYENLTNKHEKLSKKLEKIKVDYNELKDLNSQLQKALDEKEELDVLNINDNVCRPSFEQHKDCNLTSALTKIADLEAKLAVQVDKTKHLELKLYTYKQQLAETIRTNLKEKQYPDSNLNESYEKIWNELSKQRQGEEEKLSLAILDDNRKAYSIIENLKREIESLKKQSTRKSRKSDKANQPSVGAVTVTCSAAIPDLLDSSKIPEIERLRKSPSHSRSVEQCNISESSYISNNSDHLNLCEHSRFSPESEVIIPWPEKSPRGILWKTYNQKSEMDVPNQRLSLESENSNPIVVNDLGMNNNKIETFEPDILVNRDNKYVLQDLNFDGFLNELKKLTKNGSFQKVLQIFGKYQNEFNGTNRSNRLDLQELLHLITECVSAVAEPPLVNLQDKCCSTDQDLCCCNNNLKEYKKEVAKLKEEKSNMERNCKAYAKLLAAEKEDHQQAIKECRAQRLKVQEIQNKYTNQKTTIKDVWDKVKEESNKYNRMKLLVLSSNRDTKRFQKLYELSKNENDSLKTELQKLKAEKGEFKSKIDKLLQEKKSYISEWRRNSEILRPKDIFHPPPNMPPRNSYAFCPTPLSAKSEVHCNSFQDSNNESILKSNISYYVSENEEDFFNYNSLEAINKGCNDMTGDRVENRPSSLHTSQEAINKESDDKNQDRILELKRRNSLYPNHLQSAYPLETDLDASYSNFYMKDVKVQKEEKRPMKKRKLINWNLDMPSKKKEFMIPKPVRKRELDGPSTSKEPQPSTSTEPQPSTSTEPQPSTSAEPQPSTSAEQPPPVRQSSYKVLNSFTRKHFPK